jgi:ABC-type transport system involved in multi-copper enzyme maturation permease subunit
MIDFQGVLAVAWAELRVTRRLVRYWVFLGLAYLIALVSYFYYAGIHMVASSWSATAASIGPRYLMGAVGNNATLIFVVAIVFLGFDLRARDQRERMAEVLDSRPLNNLELVAGRFLGLLAAVWVPVAVLAVLIEALGLLLPLLGSPIGEPIEPWSLLTWVIFMSLPSFAFALALVFLVTLLVRNRLVAAVVLLGLLGLDIYGG